MPEMVRRIGSWDCSSVIAMTRKRGSCLPPCCDAGHGIPERFGASLQTLAFLLGDVRLEDPDDALPPDDAREGQRDAIPRAVRTDGNDRSLVPQRHLREPRGTHSDHEL